MAGLVLDGSDGRWLARGPAARNDCTVALGQPLDGPGIPQQVHRAAPDRLLGNLLRALEAGARSFTPTLTLARLCRVRGLHAAGRDLEFPARLDHSSPPLDERSARKTVVTDARLNRRL